MGRVAAVVRGVDVAVAVDVATIDVAVGVGAVGVDIVVAPVANIASSGETVRNVGAGTVEVALAVDDAAIVDRLAVDGAAGLCHGGFRNSGSRGVDRGSCIAVEMVPGVMAVAIVMAWSGSWPR